MATIFLVNMGRARYAPVTVLPMLFVATTTLTAGFLNIRDNFLPAAAQPGQAFQAYLQSVLTATMMVAGGGDPARRRPQVRRHPAG